MIVSAAQVRGRTSCRRLDIRSYRSVGPTSGWSHIFEISIWMESEMGNTAGRVTTWLVALLMRPRACQIRRNP